MSILRCPKKISNIIVRLWYKLRFVTAGPTKFEKGPTFEDSLEDGPMEPIV